MARARKAFIVAGILVSLVALVAGAEFTRVEETQQPCVGYTVIEAGKGVDCNGDTIRLRKSAGYYEVLRAR